MKKGRNKIPDKDKMKPLSLFIPQYIINNISKLDKKVLTLYLLEHKIIKSIIHKNLLK